MLRRARHAARRKTVRSGTVNLKRADPAGVTNAFVRGKCTESLSGTSGERQPGVRTIPLRMVGARRVGALVRVRLRR